MKNHHNRAIPAQIQEQVQNLLKQISELLAPYALALTPAERHELPKMGEKTLSFVEKAHELAQQNPSIRPPYLSMTDFDADFSDALGLRSLHLTARQIEEIISDTMMSAGSETYQAALVFYSAAKIAAEQNVPGAKAMYEELRVRFPRGRRKPAPSETPTEI
jgi:hypothetical protein